MNKIKCPNCNVVNWSTSEFCVRCKSLLHTSLAANFTNSFQNEPSRFSSATVIKSNFSKMRIGVYCFGFLLVCFSVYQITKPTQPKLHPDLAYYASEESKKTKKTSIIEELGIRELDPRVIDSDALTEVSKGGRPSTTVEDTHIISNDPNHPEFREIISTSRSNFDGCGNKGQNVVSKKSDYQKINGEIIATVTANVKGFDCMKKEFVTFAVTFRYVWKTAGAGINEWVKLDSNSGLSSNQLREEELSVQKEKEQKEKEQEKISEQKEQKLRLEKELEQFRK